MLQLKDNVDVASTRMQSTSVCSVNFQSQSLETSASVCFQCSYDKLEPQLYSKANSMDPGHILTISFAGANSGSIAGSHKNYTLHTEVGS